MARDLRHARLELQAATDAVARTSNARNRDEFEVAWRAYLSSLEKCWVKLERVCHGAKGFQHWQKPIKQRRASDPVLRYLFQARHVDQHTLREILEHVPGSTEIRVVGPPVGPVFVEHLEIVNGRVVDYAGSHPLEERITPARLELVPIENRGNVCQPPHSHLGAPLADATPMGVAVLGLRFCSDLLSDAEKRFGAG